MPVGITGSCGPGDSCAHLVPVHDCVLEKQTLREWRHIYETWVHNALMYRIVVCLVCVCVWHDYMNHVRKELSMLLLEFNSVTL